MGETNLTDLGIRRRNHMPPIIPTLEVILQLRSKQRWDLVVLLKLGLVSRDAGLTAGGGGSASEVGDR